LQNHKKVEATAHFFQNMNTKSKKPGKRHRRKNLGFKYIKLEHYKKAVLLFIIKKIRRLLIHFVNLYRNARFGFLYEIC